MKKDITIPTYPGPSRAELTALSDEQVLAEYERLGMEPRPRRAPYFDDYTVLEDGTLKEVKWTPAKKAKANAEADAKHQASLRSQLHWGLVQRWVSGLSSSVRWAIVEGYERKYMKARDEDFSTSAKRYTVDGELNQRATTAIVNSLTEGATK